MPVKENLRPFSLRAHALLSSLAKQSDIDYDKRNKELVMMKVAKLASLGAAVPPDLKWFIDDLKGYDVDKFEKIASLLPKGQSIFDYYILNTLREKMSRLSVDLCIPVHEENLWKEIYFGTLELGSPAAEVIPIEDTNECLIILSRGLWIATSITSGIIANFVNLDPYLLEPIGVKKEQDSLLDIEPRGEMVDQVLKGKPIEFGFPRMDNLHKFCWEILDSTMKTFIFAHEYAHVHLGHLNKYSKEAITAKCWNEEFTADIVAVQLGMRDKQVIDDLLAETVTDDVPKDFLKKFTRSLEIVHNFYVASGAVLVLYLFWRMEILNDVQISYSNSHPHIQMRINNIWNFFRVECEQADFKNIFQRANLMISHFLQLLPPMEGNWRNRFLEAAFKPLLFHNVDSVMEAIDTINNINVPLSDPSLDRFRAGLAELFKDPSADYEEKYAVLEECIQMIQVGKEADPFSTIKCGMNEKKGFSL
jgi:hypothetical protein